MTKKLILILMPVALMIGQEKKAPFKPAPSGQAETLKVPKGAKQIEPYAYSYTDPQGKKWIYRQTPFGVVKFEDKPATSTVVDNSNPVVATDLGDSVRFQRKTPFGEQTWTRKKSELSDEELAMVKRDQTKSSAPDAKADGKPASSARKAPENQ